MLLELFEALVCPAQVLSSLHLANAVWPTRHETSFRVPLHPTGEEPSASVPATAVWCCVTHQFVASVPLRHQRQGIDHHKHRACVLVLFAKKVQHRAEAVCDSSFLQFFSRQCTPAVTKIHLPWCTLCLPSKAIV